MQWGLIGQRDGLCHEDVKYLWAQADIEGDGVVDFEEFQVNFTSLVLYRENTCKRSMTYNSFHWMESFSAMHLEPEMVWASWRELRRMDRTRIVHRDRHGLWFQRKGRSSFSSRSWERDVAGELFSFWSRTINRSVFSCEVIVTSSELLELTGANYLSAYACYVV